MDVVCLTVVYEPAVIEPYRRQLYKSMQALRYIRFGYRLHCTPLLMTAVPKSTGSISRNGKMSISFGLSKIIIIIVNVDGGCER